MKLAIYRTLFAGAALGVASLAAAAWQEPGVGVYGMAGGQSQCLFRELPKADRQAHPDQDLLLFMYGLTQGVGNRS